MELCHFGTLRESYHIISNKYSGYQLRSHVTRNIAPSRIVAYIMNDCMLLYELKCKKRSLGVVYSNNLFTLQIWKQMQQFRYEKEHWKAQHV